MSFSRLMLRLAIALSAIIGSAGLDAAAQDGSSIVVASFGGRFQDAQRKAYYERFQEATGVKVIEASGISVAKIRSMVKTGNVEWDVFISVPSDMLVLAGDGLLEKIDYGAFDKATLDQIPEIARHPYGVGHLYSSQVIAFNTRTYPAGKKRPKSWAEVWDSKSFPGRRMFPAGDYTVNPIEAALLADGVPADQLYPLDLERAYRSLSKIRPAVAKWANSSSAVPQALVDGEVDIGFAAAARISELKAQGAPVDFTWSEGIVDFDYLAVPKGAKHRAEAMKFIAFASRAESVAELSRLMPYGGVNTHALDLLSEEQKQRLNSYPENLKQQVLLRADWWAQKDGSGRTNLDKNSQLWNAWITQH
jgi:putative spermidine/putrescine transport system substrate-binding protein